MTKPSLDSFIVTPDSTLLEAASTMEDNKSRAVVVVSDLSSMKVIGVLSEGDILRALLTGSDIRAPLKGFIRKSFSYLLSEDIEKAKKLFIEKGFGLLPIVDQNMKLTSVMTLLDCLQNS